MDPKVMRAIFAGYRQQAREMIHAGGLMVQIGAHALVMMADAYLAGCSADEEEPITAEWLDKCLPRSKDVGFSGQVLWQFGPFEALSMYPEREDVARVFAHEIRTRGQLRRLCAALGRPLTEPTP